MCRVYKLRTGAEPFPHPNLPGADLLYALSAANRSSTRAAEVLLRYPWPGNLRELRNVIRQ